MKLVYVEESEKMALVAHLLCRVCFRMNRFETWSGGGEEHQSGRGPGCVLALFRRVKKALILSRCYITLTLL